MSIQRATYLPDKSAADLYTAIGFHKQGKAGFYRDFLDHLQNSNDPLRTAPGTRGMVMLVFTLPCAVFRRPQRAAAEPTSSPTVRRSDSRCINKYIG